MSRVRIVGARSKLGAVVAALQDFGGLQFDTVVDVPGLAAARLSTREERERRALHRLLDDVALAQRLLGGTPRVSVLPRAVTRSDLARWARHAHQTRRAAERLAERVDALEVELRLLAGYRGLLDAFDEVLAKLAKSRQLSAYGVVVPAAERERLDRLVEALGEEIGTELVWATHVLDSGDVALLLILPPAARTRLERALATARVPEIPLPAGYAQFSLAEAAPRMRARLDEIPRELAALHAERRALAQRTRHELSQGQVAAHDRLAALDAIAASALTQHAFDIEGWAPAALLSPLRQQLASAFGPSIVVEEVGREGWVAERAPVVLSNPRLFRPFERLIALFPLPRYGSIDPTPFVAVFFPMFFGLILGDVGYGAVLAVLGLVLHGRSRPGTLARTVAEIAGPCAAFAVTFGVLYGELFGDLGRRWLGMRAVLLDREHAAIGFMAVAAGMGVVHITLGLVLGAVADLRAGHRRHAIGRVLEIVMIALIVLLLLAALDLPVAVLPRQLFTPAVIALVLAFPILVLVEGLIAPVEFLSTLGNILSYIRIMALGTASVMLAVVANEMAGAAGGTLVGVLFALLFHAVNLVVGVFSPTLHAMRLHYVEFFGKFFSPGGQPYTPLCHWRPSATPRRT